MPFEKFFSTQKALFYRGKCKNSMQVLYFCKDSLNSIKYIKFILMSKCMYERIFEINA